MKFSGDADDSLIQKRGEESAAKAVVALASRPQPRMNIAWRRLCVFSVDFHELSGLGKKLTLVLVLMFVTLI